MKWRCAWCNAALPEAERDHTEDATDGICEIHLIALKAQIAARRAKEAGR